MGLLEKHLGGPGILQKGSLSNAILNEFLHKDMFDVALAWGNENTGLIKMLLLLSNYSKSWSSRIELLASNKKCCFEISSAQTRSFLGLFLVSLWAHAWVWYEMSAIHIRGATQKLSANGWSESSTKGVWLGKAPKLMHKDNYITRHWSCHPPKGTRF